MSGDKKVQISVRVDPPVFKAIEARRGDFVGADGKDAKRSEVLRGMLDEVQPMFDPETVRRVKAVASQNGLSMSEAWASVIHAGLEVRESDGV